MTGIIYLIQFSMHNKTVHMVAFLLMAAGGLNWLLVGAFNYDLVYNLLGGKLADVVYILVGLATIVELVTHKHHCATCK